MTPHEHFQQLISKNVITSDAEQLAVVKKLQALYDKLVASDQQPWYQWVLSQQRPINGFYLWGGVGTGKTLMIDNFFNCLPLTKKLRLHFHHFMQYIHHALSQHQGIKNPIATIAKKMATETRVLVLDELIVNDIADAMILAKLFTELLKNQICLVFTTNIAPDGLYKNGLQRARFLPAIELIKQHCEIFHLTSQNDYRQQHLGINKNYLTPINETTEAELTRRFNEKANIKKISTLPLEVHGRTIQTLKHSDDVIWFDFLALCDIPRSQHDYLWLSKHYKTIIISNLPIIKANQTNLVRSFINLIDVMYDRQIQLIISAHAPINQIYTAGKLLFAFARTQSRITEIQADVTFGREH